MSYSLFRHIVLQLDKGILHCQYVTTNVNQYSILDPLQNSFHNG